MVNVVVVAFVGALVGGFAGRIGRRLLAALRRGVSSPPGWCELGVAVLWAITAAQVALGQIPLWWSSVPFVLGWFAVLLATCDVLVARLPDALTLAAYPVVVFLLGSSAFLSGTDPPLVGASTGTVLYAGTYVATRWLSPRSIGAGDVKLAGSLGAIAGSVSVPAVLLCMVSAALLTLAVAGWHGRGIPHGPAMLAPVWVTTVFASGVG